MFQVRRTVLRSGLTVAHNGLQTCEGKDLKVKIFNLKQKVIMYWYWINVFNYDSFAGSFYTDGSNRNEIIEKINNKYGKGNWNRFTCE